MQTASSVRPAQSSRLRLLVQFLGSMRLAVSLLVLLAIASVIGTILSQQQPYENYQLQFGSFWFQVFRELGLYNVYRTVWYTGIVAFLVLSTATCVTRNSPRMLRDMRALPVRQRRGAIRAQDQFFAHDLTLSPEAMSAGLADLLRKAGFRPRLERDGDDVYVAARKGRFHRLGYFLTHLAIILICAAALYNADIPVKWAEWTGALHPATNFDLPLSQIPQSAWMPLHNPAYRGIITLPEGQTADAVFEMAGNGYLVQPLPFRIHLRSFHVSYYSTGMPRDFVSDVVLYGPTGKELKSGIIRVNHPLAYDGVEIYQSSFSDGGSLLHLQSYVLGMPAVHPGILSGRVGQTLQAGSSGYSVQLKNFSLYNVMPRAAVGEKPDPQHPMVNLGPSYTYIVHDPHGGAAEFKTYFSPITRAGQSYFVQGYRQALGAPYHYMYLPVGPQGGVTLFLNYLAALQIAARSGAQASPAEFQQIFAMLAARVAPSMSRAEQDRFVQASLDALAQMRDYPAPFLLRLQSFDHRWAAGLQVTKWPGTVPIYWGCVALVLGIFILFYLPQKRIWALIEKREGGCHLELGGTADRNKREFAREFAAWERALQAAPGQEKGSLHC